MKFLEVTTDWGNLAIRPQYIHRIVTNDPAWTLADSTNCVVVTSDKLFEVHETYAELIQQLEGIGG